MRTHLWSTPALPGLFRMPRNGSAAYSNPSLTVMLRFEEHQRGLRVRRAIVYSSGGTGGGTLVHPCASLVCSQRFTGRSYGKPILAPRCTAFGINAFKALVLGRRILFACLGRVVWSHDRRRHPSLTLSDCTIERALPKVSEPSQQAGFFGKSAPARRFQSAYLTLTSF